MEHFTVEVTGNLLRIGSRPNIALHATAPVRFYLTVRQLDTIVLSGSGDVRYYGTPAIEQSTPGSGDLVRLGD